MRAVRNPQAKRARPRLADYHRAIAELKASGMSPKAAAAEAFKRVRGNS